MRLLATIIVALFVATSLSPAKAAQLVMFESASCEWCEIWDEEISQVYPKTDEGKRAPLRRVDIHGPIPSDLDHLKRAHFTPTFVLVEADREIGRIVGYPGEDFFWGLLGQIIEKLPKQIAKDGQGKCKETRNC